MNLYIMCGLVFSGKSTLARKIAEYTGAKIMAFDKLWVEKDKVQPIPESAEGWRLIRKAGQEEVAKALQEGQDVVYDDNNVGFEHREELREVTREFGAKAVVVYLNTPMELIKEREAKNRDTGERHEVGPENFKKVVEQLQVPTTQENVIEFRPEMDIGRWLQNLDNRLQ